jgi:sugar lactone lactonase YvrE
MPKGLVFKAVEGRERLPSGCTHRDVVAVAVGARDRGFVLTRGDARVVVYERDGNFAGSWDEGLSAERTHGIAIGSDESVYSVDDADRTARKFTPQGQLIMTLGTAGEPSDSSYDTTWWLRDNYKTLASTTHGGPPFNKPTDVAVAPNGDLYVSDGSGNARVHRFSADGQLLQSWGSPAWALDSFTFLMACGSTRMGGYS